MSGGSWNYFYREVEDVAGRLLFEACPLRRALGIKLKHVAKALHDIEWVDSSDYGKGDEIKAIKAALGSDGVTLTADAAVAMIELAIEAGRKAIGTIRDETK